MSPSLSPDIIWESPRLAEKPTFCVECGNYLRYGADGVGGEVKSILFCAGNISHAFWALYTVDGDGDGDWELQE